MDWNDAYAIGKYIPGAESLPLRWQEAAQDWRMAENVAGRARLNLPYGSGARQVLDLFLPASRPIGVLVFVHGGYWHEFDNKSWSHLAAGATARDWAVVMPSYTLAPQAGISEITREIATAVEKAATLAQGPIVLAGHSAGGHLVARMLCRDVALSGDVLARLRRVVPIAPLSDLRPLMKTDMNDVLRLDEAEARAGSPLLEDAPRDVPVTVWVGADERPALLDQARRLAAHWSQAELIIEPGLHHFDVIDGLAEADSPLMRTLIG